MGKKKNNQMPSLNKCSNSSTNSSNQTVPLTPTHSSLMEGNTVTKERKFQMPTLNKSSNLIKKERKLQIPTLNNCSNTSNSCTNKQPRSFTTVVKRTTTITTTITTNTTLLPEENMDEDVSLYICVLKDTRDKDSKDLVRTFTWFKIDPEAHTSTKGVPLEPLTPFCQMPNSTPEQFQAVAFGSEIYTLGGSYWKYNFGHGPVVTTNSNKVFVCDTLASPPVWKECPSMKLPRRTPAAAAVDGLLYAMGSLGSTTCHLDPWAEVFNFSSQTWASLPPAPQGSLPTENSAFTKESGKLVVFSRWWGDHPAHAFDCKTQTWKNIPISISDRDNVVSYKARSIAVGSMVYTFNKRRLYALDLSQLEPCVQQVYGLEEGLKQLPGYYSLVVHPVHIGRGKMCLVWGARSSQRENSIIIYCLKFWVGTCPGESRLQAIIDRCDKYIADGGRISNCLTI